MKLEKSIAEKLIISGIPNQDPIAVYFEDIGPGQGKITITCFNDCWSYFWGGMGKKTPIREFFRSCNTSYIAHKLSPETEGTVYDFCQLPQHAKKRICELRRDDDLSETKARELFDEADRLYAADDVSDLDRDIMFEIYGEDWYDCLPRQANHKYEYLCRIIELVKEAILKESEQCGEINSLNNAEVIENLREQNKAMAAVFTKIADYLGVEQGDVPGLLEEITMLKESAELLSRMADLIEALRPFVDAFDKIKECHLSDNNELQAFKDSNLVIPSMSIGHFRKLHEAFNRLKGK
ncbi:hypothetical protein [Desulforegula conservatrix]|uniref:hypothetical protein n=1 Tax=Desulforegula conservatrix TaxID=153026 RepID=UPI000409CE82|nr:hypothetical protein [Desulforegula conservatrix]